MMTKKDYNKFAKMLKNIRVKIILDTNLARQQSRLELLNLIMLDMMIIFSEDNPDFDDFKFSTACNV